jgi:GMP synthase (glutamine-hydrolysing)
MPEVWVLQHIQCEPPGIIANALEYAGITAKCVRTFNGEQVPREMGVASGLIVMGGPMGVYDQDRYPFLRDEMRLIDQALREEKPLLGICLGSQLLAAVLGAEVKKGNKKEIGWYPVTPAETTEHDRLWKDVRGPFVAYHWHGDVFDLPYGASLLASSRLSECQAYRYGRTAYGFLFHMEVTDRIINDMLSTFTDELHEEAINPDEILRASREHLPQLQKIGKSVFPRWAGLVERQVAA